MNPNKAHYIEPPNFDSKNSKSDGDAHNIIGYPKRKHQRKTFKKFVHRHSITVRLTHWLNTLCIAFLLLSGLQIFNAHPYLYWGNVGYSAGSAFIAINSENLVSTDSTNEIKGYVRVGSLTFDTTGVLGASKTNGAIESRAFPAWLTIPTYRDLGAGRHWHFFFAWIFFINGILYWIYGVSSRHFRHHFLPSREQLSFGSIWHELKSHARLNFTKGRTALRYNTLQKLSYILVVFVLLPMIILTGLSMAPGINATFPFLDALFGGRASARTLHFISAFSLVIFIVVHLAMVLASGLWNNIRSMITGRYLITYGKNKS